MRVPLSWLKDYVDITVSAKELAERLRERAAQVGRAEGFSYAEAFKRLLLS